MKSLLTKNSWHWLGSENSQLIRVRWAWVCCVFCCCRRQSRALILALSRAVSKVLLTLTLSSTSAVAIAIMSLITLMIVATVVRLSTGRRATDGTASVLVVVAAFVWTLCRLFSGVFSSEFCFLDKFGIALRSPFFQVRSWENKGGAGHLRAVFRGGKEYSAQVELFE